MKARHFYWLRSICQVTAAADGPIVLDDSALARIEEVPHVQSAYPDFARSQDVPIDFSLFSFPWWLLGSAVLFSVVVSVVAGVYPASRAARVDPIHALRGL